MLRKLYTLMAVLVCAGCAPALTSGSAAPTRVILIVGDGVGLPHWSLLRLAGDREPAVSEMTSIGLVDTRCDCARTTDSGASATAYAIGQRTAYRFIGMTRDSTPATTVLETALARGMATGLVTTTHITDATPAAFAAHAASRYDRFGIAAQVAQKQVDVLLGGGYAFFARRPDGRDLTREMAADYTVVRTPASFANIDPATTPRLLGLFADSTTWGERHLRPSLPEMARTAIAMLDRNPRGMFLLLESEDTDDVFHDNDPAADAIAAMRELDETVAVALEYRRRRPETLVVVIGDHATGGLATQIRTADGMLDVQYTTTGHSADMVPVFAAGPGAPAFARWLRNDEVGQLLLRAVAGGRLDE